MHTTTTTTGRPPAPDIVPCCDTAVYSGGDDCSCWEPILATLHPVAPAPEHPVQEGPVCARRGACHDCAYRAGSPERTELGGGLPDYTATERFYCHDGMPVLIGWQHPTGTIRAVDLTSNVVDYHPRIGSDRAWRTDGRPAVLCAGWAAVNGIPRADPAVHDPEVP